MLNKMLCRAVLSSVLAIFVIGYAQDNDQFLEQYNTLRHRGLNPTQIYNKLKLKNESFQAFGERVKRAKMADNKIPLDKPVKQTDDSYPYQKPQNFDPKHVQDNFYFLGDITLYGNNNDIWELKQHNGDLIARIQGGILYQLSPTKASTQNKNSAFDDMQNFRIIDGKPLRYTLNSNNKSLPEIRVSMEKNQHIITMYIGTASAVSMITVKDAHGNEHTEQVIMPVKGFKIIYDNNKLRDYLTQTFFYKIMLSGYKYPVIGFGLGFSIDPTKIALINTNDPVQIINIFNMKLIFKVGESPANNEDKNVYYDSEPLTLQDKINENNYREKIQYTDLFAVGAIKIQPLGTEDAAKIAHQ